MKSQLALAVLPLAVLLGATPAEAADPVTLPFELVNQHIMLQVTVNDSRPLWFVLDTGDKYGVIDLDRAKEFGLKLGAEVGVKGTSAASAKGAFVQDANFRVVGLAGFSQPVTVAIPLKELTPRFGHDFDGILGKDFIQEFVVEIDYLASRIRLHDKSTFAYAGEGESLPIAFNRGGHPLLQAEVTIAENETVAGTFVLDIGAGGALTLNSPFVTEHHLPRPDTKSVRGIGSGGVGGGGSGRAGRVRSLRIGKYALPNPTTFFSEDAAGAHSESDALGSIGARAMNRFKLFLDYGHDRIVLEPNASFSQPFDQATSGLLIEAGGTDYRTFRIVEVLEESPAAEAGLRVNDVLEAVDDRAAAELTLTQILQMFERKATYKLKIRRAGGTLIVTLIPRPLI